jgi:AcrR family transcriptional regulator
MAALAAEPHDQRSRILDAALHLMAASGVHAMSMRRLADACGLNVATLYHYFPSKADLLHEVVAHQRYDDLLAAVPPIATDAAPAERLAELLRWIWREMATQDDMWRLLLGESLRGDRDVMSAAADLTVTFERALRSWLAQLLPELAEPDVVARVLRGLVYGFFIEYLPLPYDDRMRFSALRADEIAGLVVASTARH